MKATRSRHPYDTLQTVLNAAFPIDQRRLAVLCALVLAVIQARTVVLYTLKNYVPLPGTRDCRYQRLLRFVRFTVPDGLYTHFVLKLPPPGDLWLILDRTNWKLGKQDVNILLLSASWQSFSFPLLWTLLPHGGSSHQRDRITLLERFLALRSDRRIAGLLADREFVGEQWFTCLRQHGITPCIRLKASSRPNGIPVRACFAALRPGELRVWHCPAVVYGVRLRVLAARNASGEVLYLAYQGHPEQSLRRYAQRWHTEMPRLRVKRPRHSQGRLLFETAAIRRRAHCGAGPAHGRQSVRGLLGTRPRASAWNTFTYRGAVFRWPRRS